MRWVEKEEIENKDEVGRLTGTRARLLVWDWKIGRVGDLAMRSSRAGLAQSLSQGRNSPLSQREDHCLPSSLIGLNIG